VKRLRRIFLSGAVVLLTTAMLSADTKVEQAKGEAEVFKYSFKWSVIPAASAEIKVRQEVRDGQRVTVVEAKARSSRLVDPFWKMRDQAEAVFLTDSNKPLSYKLTQKENHNNIETYVTFDNEARVAKVKWEKRKGKREDKKELEIPFNNARDPITTALFLRGMDLQGQDNHEVEVVGGKSMYRIRIEKVKTERIRIKAGKFDAIKLKASAEKIYPEPDDPGKEKKVESLYIWVSDEESPKLLKLQAKAFVGSVKGYLTK